MSIVTTRGMARLVVTALATVVVGFAAASMAAQEPQKPSPASVAGRWAAALDIEAMGIANVTLSFVQEGAKLTGTYTGRYGEFPLEGSVDGRKLAFTVYLKTEAGDSTMSFMGEVAEDGRTMKGGLSIEGMGDATWSARRQPQPPGL